MGVFDSLEAAVIHAVTLTDDDVMVIGGAGLYAQALTMVGRIYLTEVHAAVTGDVTFPAFERQEWVETSRERFSAGDEDDHDYSFVILNRIMSD